MAGYAHALMALDTGAATAQALPILEKAAQRDNANAQVLQDLAMAYARQGDNGKAALATAERFALSGRLKDARLLAERSMGLLPKGSPGWRKAQDIVSVAQRAGI